MMCLLAVIIRPIQGQASIHQEKLHQLLVLDKDMHYLVHHNKQLVLGNQVPDQELKRPEREGILPFFYYLDENSALASCISSLIIICIIQNLKSKEVRLQTNGRKRQSRTRQDVKNGIQSIAFLRGGNYQQKQNISLLNLDQEPIKSYSKKPIKSPFSDHESDSSNSSRQKDKKHISSEVFLPPKPKVKSVLQQAQNQMKWNRDEEMETEILAKIQGTGMKDKKIRELASKYKTLNIAYERQKTMRKNLENQLNNTMRIQQEETKKLNESTFERRQSLQKSSISKKQKCGNCAEWEKKIMEMRLKNQSMKTDLNKAQRLIAREIGQNFDIDQALSEDNAWKGRQQKIEKLKSRVKQLEDRLQNQGVNVSHMSGFTQMTTANNLNQTNNFSTTRTSTLAENKRKQFDNLKLQVDTLKSQNQLLQAKIKSLASRKIILENQIKDIKTEYQKKKLLFVEKSENDDKFISLLKQENQKLKKEEKVITKVIYKDGNSKQKNNAKENSEELQILRREIEQLKKKVKSANSANKSQQQISQGSISNTNIPILPTPNSTMYSKQQKLQTKTINEMRQISAEKKKNIEQEYLKGDKYLKKMSAEEESQIYRAWKQGRNI